MLSFFAVFAIHQLISWATRIVQFILQSSGDRLAPMQMCPLLEDFKRSTREVAREQFGLTAHSSKKPGKAGTSDWGYAPIPILGPLIGGGLGGLLIRFLGL